MALTRQSTWAVVALVAFACGGKTELVQDVDPGSSASGGSAQGAGGSSGVSGAAGRGGSPGGAAGRGGSPGTGGSAGSGGAVVGGTGGVGGGALIEAICSHYEAHGCDRAAGCRDLYKGGFNTAEGSGCGDEWLTIFSCVLDDPTPCDAPMSCPGGFALHEKCVTEAIGCNRPSGGCSLLCYSWAAECTASNAGLHCTCKRGPRAGTRFDTSAACQSDEWENALRAACE